MHVSAVLGLEGGVGNIVNRSLVARVVSGEELGTVYGLLAILDAVLPFIGLQFFLKTFCVHKNFIQFALSQLNYTSTLYTFFLLPSVFSMLVSSWWTV